MPVLPSQDYVPAVWSRCEACGPVMADAEANNYMCRRPMPGETTHVRLCCGLLWPWPEANAIWALFAGGGFESQKAAVQAIRELADATPWDPKSATWMAL